MSRNRCFTSAVQELLRAVGRIEDAHRRHANCGATAVMVPRNPRGIGGLVKFPEGLDARMHTLRASEQFTTDAHVRNVPIGEDGARDGNGQFRVVCRFTDPPFVLRVPQVSGDDRPRSAFETSDALRIPVEHVLMREHFCLLADGVTGSDAREAAEDAISYCESHVGRDEVEAITRGMSAVGKPEPRERRGDLVENRRIVDRRRHAILDPVRDLLIVPRRILPERVLGSRGTMAAVLKHATGPIRSRTIATRSGTMASGARCTPAFSTMNPRGTSPFSASATPTTAHSATSGCEASTSSIAPVESRWPATLMMSSVRFITQR